VRIAVDKSLLLTLRAALIAALNAVEDALSMPRSCANRKERQEAA
jgi:hypothetical protein